MLYLGWFGFPFLCLQIHKAIDLEREHQLQALENNFGRYITSLQFQRDAKLPQTLELHTALIRLQALLLEELFTSKTLTMSECAEITQRSNCVSNKESIK